MVRRSLTARSSPAAENTELTRLTPPAWADLLSDDRHRTLRCLARVIASAARSKAQRSGGVLLPFSFSPSPFGSLRGPALAARRSADSRRSAWPPRGSPRGVCAGAEPTRLGASRAGFGRRPGRVRHSHLCAPASGSAFELPTPPPWKDRFPALPPARYSGSSPLARAPPGALPTAGWRSSASRPGQRSAHVLL